MRAIVILIFSLISLASHAQSEYYNPIDGKTYIGDWKTYQPEDGAKEEKGRVVSLGVRLMNTDCELKKNITVQDLAALVTSVQGIFAEKVKGHKESGEVLIQITLDSKKNPDFKISFQGDLQKEYLEKSSDSLSTLDYKTKQSAITLQVHLKIKNA